MVQLVQLYEAHQTSVLEGWPHGAGLNFSFSASTTNGTQGRYAGGEDLIFWLWAVLI